MVILTVPNHIGSVMHAILPDSIMLDTSSVTNRRIKFDRAAATYDYIILEIDSILAMKNALSYIESSMSIKNRRLVCPVIADEAIGAIHNINDFKIGLCDNSIFTYRDLAEYDDALEFISQDYRTSLIPVNSNDLLNPTRWLYPVESLPLSPVFPDGRVMYRNP